MEVDPLAGDVQPLKNQPAAFRRRVGDWRIFFDLDLEHRVVAVPYIERRTSTTYRKRR
ncbi:MAG: type II toxin-antitoxin system RelE family toxin [Planctomycetota bacterium]